MKPVGSAEVNSHFGLLGLGVAPRFLQKVRAFAEILTNKLGLLPRRGGAKKIARTDDLEGSAYGARGIEIHCGHTNHNLENHPVKGSPRGALRRLLGHT